MAKFLPSILLASIVCACAFVSRNEYVSLGPTESKNDGVERIRITSAPSAFKLGGLSGLFFAQSESTAKETVFYTITDRGPNGDTKPLRGHPGFVTRPFHQPTYSPQIIRLVFDRSAHTVQAGEPIQVRRPDGSPATGVPNVNRMWTKAAHEEVPVDLNGKRLNLDPMGLDTEGIVLDEHGGFWACEEYGPSLLKIDRSGRIVKRWGPAKKGGLPEFLKRRDPNRGFEGIAWSERKTLLLFLQSPMHDVSIPGWIPVVEFDPEAERTVGLYLYPASPDGGKIGDATLASDGTILVIEQNGKTGKKAWQRLFRVSSKEASNLLAEARAAGLAFQPSAAARPLVKQEVYDLSAQGFSDVEKLEGLALGPDGEPVILNDNDFSVNGPSESFFFLLKARKL